MAEFTLRFYNGGDRPLRTDVVDVETVSDAVQIVRARLRGSRFVNATIHAPSGSVTQVDEVGMSPSGYAQTPSA